MLMATVVVFRCAVDFDTPNSSPTWALVSPADFLLAMCCSGVRGLAEPDAAKEAVGFLSDGSFDNSFVGEANSGIDPIFLDAIFLIPYQYLWS